MWWMFVALAGAAPLSIQGQLSDADGEPIEGSLSVDFALYGQPTGGAPVWEETQAVDFEGGGFTVELGANIPLDDALFRSNPALWLGDCHRRR